FDEPNLLFRGLANGRFEEVQPRGGTAQLLSATSRAAAFGDLDGDGGIDVVVINRDSPAYLLMNHVARRGHWISFRVREESGADALGARVRFSVGARTIVRTVRSAYSYCAASDPKVHVGLGPEKRVEAVEVEWVDGAKETFGSGFAADDVHELRRRAA